MDSLSGPPCNDLLVYDVVQNSWTQLQEANGDIPIARYGHIADAIGDTHMVIYGGYTSSNNARRLLNDAFLYNLNSHTWKQLSSPGSLAGGRTFAASVLFDYSTFVEWVVFGGESNGTDPLSLILRLSLDSVQAASEGEWSRMNTSRLVSVPPSRSYASFIKSYIGDKQLGFLYGGALITGSKVKSFDDTWYIAGGPGLYYWTQHQYFNRPPQPRAGVTAVFLKHDLILIFGGVYKELSSWLQIAPPMLWQISISDYELGQWVLYSPPVAAIKGVTGHTSVVRSITDSSGLTINVMLVFGGLLGDGQLNNDLLAIAPSLMFWYMSDATGVKVKPSPRAFHSAVIDKRAVMYIFGGLSGPNNTEVLSDTWSVEWVPFGTSESNETWICHNKSEQVPPARYAHTAVQTYDSNLSSDVMVIFGGTNGTAVFADVWKFVFTTRQWHKLNPFGTRVPAVYGHTAVILGPFMVVIGGCSQAPNNSITVNVPFPVCPSGNLTSQTFYLHVSDGYWYELQTLEGTPRYLHTTLVHSGVSLTYGGFNGTFNIYDDIQLLNPGCNLGQRGQFGKGTCVDCPIGTYSDTSGPDCFKCNTLFTTSTIGSVSDANCSICEDHLCRRGGICTVTKGNYAFDCDCSFLFPGRTCDSLWPLGAFMSTCLLVLLIPTIYFIIKMVRYRKQVNRHAELLTKQQTEIRNLVQGWKINPEEIEYLNRIGSGSYGEVWRAKYREMIVAVKKIENVEVMFGPESEHKVEREMEFMRRTRHPNVVLFLGGGRSDTDAGLFIVTEYMKCGSLNVILYDLAIHLDKVQQVRFAVDVAKGMRFLHNLSPPCIHRDLKVC